MKKKYYDCIVLIIAVLAFCGPASPGAGAKIYWHFTIKAFVDLPDTNGVEWAWITMVEYDASKAYPAEAEVAAEYGGELKGTVLAFVRVPRIAPLTGIFGMLPAAAARRKARRSGNRASDSVFAMGRLISSRPFRGLPGTVPPEP